MSNVVRAVLICSDEECTERFDAYGPIEELAALACDCGCALAIVGWPDDRSGDVASRGVELLAA